MKRYFFDFWNRLERSLVLDAESPEQRRSRATLIVISSLTVIAGLLGGTNTYVFAGATSAMLVQFMYSLIVGLAILVYFATRQFSLLLYTFLFMILFTPLFFHLFIGGFASPITIVTWSILAPMGSLLVLNIKRATYCFLVYLAVVFVALFLDATVKQFAVPVPHSEFVVAHGINSISLSVVVFLTTLYFVSAFVKENTRAQGLLSDLKQANGTLETTLDQLHKAQSELVQSEKTAALGKLVAGVVHELNTPVGAINSATDLSIRCVNTITQSVENSHTLEELKANRRLQAAMNALRDSNPVAMAASERITKIVQSLKSFTRLDEATLQEVDLHEGLESTLTLIEHEYRERIDVKKDFGLIPPVSCNPGELNQVFLNLLTNAGEAIEGKGTITIRTSAQKGTVHVQIEDTGIGLSPEQIQGIFEPRFTTGGSRVRAGMGLFTSYNIVQKHRGQISVNSTPGQGSIFTIALPIDSSDSEPLKP